MEPNTNTSHTLKVRDTVTFCDQELHDLFPEYFPAPGTVGTVVRVGIKDCKVKWPGSDIGKRWAPQSAVVFCSQEQLDGAAAILLDGSGADPRSVWKEAAE